MMVKSTLIYCTTKEKTTINYTVEGKKKQPVFYYIIAQ